MRLVAAAILGRVWHASLHSCGTDGYCISEQQEWAGHPGTLSRALCSGWQPGDSPAHLNICPFRYVHPVPRLELASAQLMVCNGNCGSCRAASLSVASQPVTHPSRMWAFLCMKSSTWPSQALSPTEQHCAGTGGGGNISHLSSMVWMYRLAYDRHQHVKGECILLQE